MIDPLVHGDGIFLLKTPDDPNFTNMLSRRSSIIQDGFDYWRSKGGPDDLPGREDIDPMEMFALLPNVVLLDIRREPVDFFYRLVGTGVVYHQARDLTGLWMSEAKQKQSPSQIWRSRERVVASKVPLLSNAPYIGPHDEYLFEEDIILPLGDGNGVVNKLLVFIAYIKKPFADA